MRRIQLIFFWIILYDIQLKYDIITIKKKLLMYWLSTPAVRYRYDNLCIVIDEEGPVWIDMTIFVVFGKVGPVGIFVVFGKGGPLRGSGITSSTSKQVNIKHIVPVQSLVFPYSFVWYDISQ
jgi:hypothetical protein